MRRVILASLLAAAWGAAGCNSQPTTPFGPSSLVPSGSGRATPATGGYWLLTATLTSVAGPPVCFLGRVAVGTRLDRLLDVQLNGEGITLLYDVRDYPIDQLELVGAVHGDRFEAATSWLGYQPCGGVRVDYEFDSYVTGALAEDGRTILASERWTYRLNSGEVVVLWFAWEAERS